MQTKASWPYGLITATIMLALSGCGGTSGDSAAPAMGDMPREISYSNDWGEYRALVHTPAAYTPNRPLPLLVMVHGCATGPYCDPLRDSAPIYRSGFVTNSL